MVEYRRVVLTFLDVLGFRRFFYDATELPELVKRIKAFRLHAGWAAKLSNSRIVEFSDSVIVASDYKDHNSLIEHLEQLGVAVADLAIGGIFVRGATTIGEHFHEDEILVSPALARAYELESKNAIFPRVVLDPSSNAKIASDFASDTNGFAKLNAALDSVTRLAEDGFRFLDFHQEFFKFAEEESAKVKRLGPYVQHLRTGLTNSDYSIKSKFIWLAKYHLSSLNERWPYGAETYSFDLIRPFDNLDLGVTHK